MTAYKVAAYILAFVLGYGIQHVWTKRRSD